MKDILIAKGLEVATLLDNWTHFSIVYHGPPQVRQYLTIFFDKIQIIESTMIKNRAHTILYVAAGYHVLFILSKWLVFSWLAKYRLSWEEELTKNTAKYNKKYRDLVNQSAIHFVSWMQSLVVLYLSSRAIYLNNQAAPRYATAAERIFGYDEHNIIVCVYAIGYFIWDTYISLMYSTFPFVLHGLISTIVYAIGLKPYINYYAGIFLMFELSNPFLNIRWFGIKYFPQISEESNSIASKLANVVQLINNVVLILTFFAARICWGFYQFYRLCSDFYEVRESVAFQPLETAFIVVGNLCLDVLNLIWLSAMVSVALRIIKKGGRVQAK